ncbi:unnamed protein product, partial [Mesorhabditis belari]|uniref:Protein quiver n=1 Tax=Mesorhabditis belari TaxID=2138241 RepID=A0AAF3ES41_9BILA
MRCWLFIITLINLFQIGKPVHCVLCDSFSGYCDFDGSTCVGKACVTRTSIIEEGMTRVQKMCSTSNSLRNAAGCHTTFLWADSIGQECLCTSDFCNSSPTPTLSTYFALLVVIFIEL